MARIAAYYQEDFHQPSTRYGRKHRKSAYLLVDDPRHNLLQNDFEVERLRALGSSEPTLSPLHYMTDAENMALKQTPLMYGNSLIDPQIAFQNLEHFYNMPDAYSNNHQYADAVFDNASVCSFAQRNSYDDGTHHRTMSRNRSRKRFSYAEPQGMLPMIATEMHIDPFDRRNMCDNRIYPQNIHQQRLYHNDSSPVRWQPSPWVPSRAFHNPMMLSPPSPLDSGLSSQSITSSPSYEADLNVFPHDYAPDGRHPICKCPHPAYPENRYRSSSRLNRHDSDRSNDTQYSESYRASRSECAIADFELQHKYAMQVRYGKMGLLGEPTEDSRRNREQVIHHQTGTPKDRKHPIRYEYVDENGIPFRETSRSRKHSKSKQRYIRPFVVINESSEMAAGEDETTPSPKETKSPESPMSVEASTSNSSASIASSVNDGDSECPRKSRKETENEIRELEDMYQRCNLNDRDLLDRAERRDLPVPHQTISKGLKRSKSDTLYEMSSPLFHNSYENPQRAPPSRRSGLPDRVADDMALRKLRKSSSRRTPNPLDNTITYMLCSSHFTPTVPSAYDVHMTDNPDVEFDDLCYRKHYFRKKSQIPDPQPPFGIPLRPPPPGKVYTDYLHAVPSGVPQPICHPRGNPDVVRDDLAFRALRKDEPERLYYDIAQVYTTKSKKRH